MASTQLVLATDNTFQTLAVGLWHAPSSGTAEVRGNQFNACQKGLDLAGSSGMAYVSCNSFLRGVTSSARSGVSYGIYSESNSVVTLADPQAPPGNPAILKNLFDANGAPTSFYALYNANSSAMLVYDTYDNYWSSVIAPVVNSYVSHQSPNANYPNNNTDCHLISPSTGLQRSAVATAPYDSKARLDQNAPNPAHGTTSIGYTVGKGTQKASLLVRRALDGQIVFTQPLSITATQCDLLISGYPAGLYCYTLVVDGVPAVTRRLSVE